MKTKNVVLLFMCLGLATIIHGQGMLQITFDGLPVQPPNTATLVTNYNEAGVSFTPINPTDVNSAFVRVGANPRTERPDDGSVYLQGLLGSTLMFSFTNGSVFDLLSVDLAEYSTVVSNAVTVEFVGYHPDGSTVTTSFTTDGII